MRKCDGKKGGVLIIIIELRLINKHPFRIHSKVVSLKILQKLILKALKKQGVRKAIF